MRNVLLCVQLLAFLIFTACSLPSVSQGAQLAADPYPCVSETQDELRLLHQAHHEAVDTINLYTHPCTGGLYLVEPNKAPEVLNVLWEGWWLQGLYRPQWIESDNGRVLELTGRFITGAGPTGAQPFDARFRITQSDSGWRVTEPQVDIPQPQGPQELNCLGRTLFVVREQAELDYLNLSNEPWAVEFGAERLVLVNADVHTSTDAIVRTDGSRYFLQERKHPDAFSISTTFTRPGLLWMVVPKDDLSISMGRDWKARRVCAECRAGALVTMHRLAGFVSAIKKGKEFWRRTACKPDKPSRPGRPF